MLLVSGGYLYILCKNVKWPAPAIAMADWNQQKTETKMDDTADMSGDSWDRDHTLLAAASCDE